MKRILYSDGCKIQVLASDRHNILTGLFRFMRSQLSSLDYCISNITLWNYGTSVARTSDNSDTFWQSLRIRVTEVLLYFYL